MPGQASGSSMRHSERDSDRPQQAAASRTCGAIDSKPRWIGCTANGRLNSTEAATSPSKLKASGLPKSARQTLPSEDSAPMPTSR